MTGISFSVATYSNFGISANCASRWATVVLNFPTLRFRFGNSSVCELDSEFSVPPESPRASVVFAISQTVGWSGVM